MRIGFLLGSADISGGTYVIFEHGSRLQEMGHQVMMITRTVVDRSALGWHPAAMSLEWVSLAAARTLPFDCLIATWWQSVFLLDELQADRYLYFVQSIESRFFPEQSEDAPETRDINVLRDWCETTYAFPLPVITEARWIQKYLRKVHNRPAFLARNGIRKDVYSSEGPSLAPREPGRIRVLVEGPLGVFFKNVERTIELCRRSEVDEIWLLTASPVTEYPGVDRCFSRVEVAKTPEIYRSCDVLVKLSYVEGMFGPPLEMFHCGGTAVVYDVTGHDEYIVHGKNGLVIQKDDEDGVVAALNRLKNEHSLLPRLVSGAAETAAQWPDWREASKHFAETVAAICRDEERGAPFLSEYIRNAGRARDCRFKSREYERMIEREGRARLDSAPHRNFIQVYWNEGAGFTNEQMVGQAYFDDRWERCSVTLPAMHGDCVLRLDPSVRIGVLWLRAIRIIGEDQRLLWQWRAGDGLGGMQLAGTCQCLQIDPQLVIFAYGEDPQLILPGVYSNTKQSVRVEVELREKGITAAFSELGLVPDAFSVKRFVAKIRRVFRKWIVNPSS